MMCFSFTFYISFCAGVSDVSFGFAIHDSPLMRDAKILPKHSPIMQTYNTIYQNYNSIPKENFTKPKSQNQTSINLRRFKDIHHSSPRHISDQNTTHQKQVLLPIHFSKPSFTKLIRNVKQRYQLHNVPKHIIYQTDQKGKPKYQLKYDNQQVLKKKTSRWAFST